MGYALGGVCLSLPLALTSSPGPSFHSGRFLHHVRGSYRPGHVEAPQASALLRQSAVYVPGGDLLDTVEDVAVNI